MTREELLVWGVSPLPLGLQVRVSGREDLLVRLHVPHQVCEVPVTHAEDPDPHHGPRPRSAAPVEARGLRGLL